MNETGEILFLSRSEIEEIFTPIDAFNICKKTFKWINEGKVNQVHNKELLTHLATSGIADYCLPYTAHIKHLKVCGIKWLSVYNSNLAKGLPYHSGVNILNDIETGFPIAIMEALSITSLRTAGNAGVGAKYLAKKGSEIITLIGCGREARWHLRLMNQLFKLREVRIFDIEKKSALKFKKEMEDIVKLEICLFSSIEKAVRGADIVCEVTTSDYPIIMENWVENGCHIVGTNIRGIDPKLTSKVDKWVLGNRESDLRWIEAKPEKYSKEYIYASLDEIVVGMKAGREDDGEKTLVTHRGMGALDVAAMYVIYNKALQKGVGTKLNLI